MPTDPTSSHPPAFDPYDGPKDGDFYASDAAAQDHYIVQYTYRDLQVLVELRSATTDARHRAVLGRYIALEVWNLCGVLQRFRQHVGDGSALPAHTRHLLLPPYRDASAALDAALRPIEPALKAARDKFIAHRDRGPTPAELRAYATVAEMPEMATLIDAIVRAVDVTRGMPVGRFVSRGPGTIVRVMQPLRLLGPAAPPKR